jgi:hypothetical protein
MSRLPEKSGGTVPDEEGESMSEIEDALDELDIFLPGRSKKPRAELAKLRAAKNDARMVISNIVSDVRTDEYIRSLTWRNAFKWLEMYPEES